MRSHQAIVMGTLACVGVAAHAAPPVTQPAEVESLVRQLGDDSYAARAAALRRLREIGKPALPALKDALRSEDPEVHLRADELINEFGTPPIPADLPEPPVAGNGGYYPARYREEEHDGIRIVDASENGRSIHIERYPTGVIMTVSGQIAGRPATRTYRFRELADLQKINPRAYVVYLAYLRNDSRLPNGFGGNVQVQVQAGGFIQIIRPRVGRGGIPMVPVPPMPMRAQVQKDELDGLELKLLEQMRQQHIAPPQQDQVSGLLRDMRAARPTVFDPLNLPELQQQAQEFNRKSDELRRLLLDLKLPDPGEALPRVGTK